MPGATTPRRCVADVIEDLGFGLGQLRVVFLASAVPFGMGSHLALLSIVTASAAEDFSLDDSQQSYLMTAAFVGLMFGCLVGGRLGDRLGRRYPIVISLFALAASGLLAALAPRWSLVLFCSATGGFAVGAGLPAAYAIVSEVSPKGFRTTARAVSDAFFDFGFIYAALIGSIQDPSFQVLQWRRLFVWASIPLTVLGSLALFFLHESPAFLAASGLRKAAEESLAAMRRLNGTESRSLAFATDCKGAPMEEAAGQPCIALSKRFFYVTVTIAYAAFFLNVFYYGGMYMQSQVNTHSWQMMSSGCLDLLGLAAAAWLAWQMSRPNVLSFALAGGAATAWCFAIGAGTTERNIVVELVFQFGTMGFYWVPSLGFIGLYQIAVEVFPTNAAATGVGLALAAGRLGAILTPDLLSKFEATTGRLSYFCYFIALLCAVGSILVTVVLGRSGWERAMEASPLLIGPAHCKAAGAEA